MFFHFVPEETNSLRIVLHNTPTDFEVDLSFIVEIIHDKNNNGFEQAKIEEVRGIIAHRGFKPTPK